MLAAEISLVNPKHDPSLGDEKWRRDVPLGLEFGLRNYWYPIALSGEVFADKPRAVTALCEELLIWRDGSGTPHTFIDSCPHRAVRLSIGHVLKDRLQCAYHGLQFDATGQCIFIPWENGDSEKCKAVHAKVYPTREFAGFIWSYIGEVESFPPPPLEDVVPLEMFRDDIVTFVRREPDWDVNWLLAWDGSIDPLHHAFIHGDGVTIRELGGQEGIYKLAAREVPNGVRLQRLGADGEVESELSLAWMLPGMNTQVVVRPGSTPIVKRVWRFPIDGSRTQALACWSRLARNSEERQTWEYAYNTRILPDSQRVNLQDKFVVETQKGLQHARSNEQLLNCDVGIVRVRRMLRDAFLAQREGRRLSKNPNSPILFEPWIGILEDPRMT